MTKSGIIHHPFSKQRPPAPQALTHREAYAGRTKSVRHIETHISHVFLTDRFAYKIKKPVSFEFLDFSTLEQRRWMCAEEVRLNRRLAPDVYLDVVPIIRDSSGNVRVEQEGTPIEWAVKMRRLTDTCRFDHLLQNHRLAAGDVERIVKLLVTFYRDQPPSDRGASKYVGQIRKHVEANRADLLQWRKLPACERPRNGKLADCPTIRRTHSRQLAFLTLKQPLFAARTCHAAQPGRIIEGHGDLRPEHLYLEEYPVAIDCVEFSEPIRTVDVADELMFLAMECELLGKPAIGNEIAMRCLDALHDDPPASLLAFYRAYRACVRAKVAALRSEQLADDEQSSAIHEANAYLAIADRASRELGSPLLIVVRGLMGTGKSTIAEEVSRLLSAELLQTDAIRQDLLGASESDAAYGKGNYSPALRQRIYDEMFERAQCYLNNGINVVLDGTFLKRNLREAALHIAKQHYARFLIANCLCRDEVLYDRIRSRSNDESCSEARPDLLAAQREDEEPLDERVHSVDLDTTKDVDQSVVAMIDAL